MSQIKYIDYDYSQTSLDDGFYTWAKGEGRLLTLGGGHLARGKVIPGPHWTGKWIGTQGLGNCGTHVIVPVSREARKMVRDHTIVLWVNRHGISYRQAEALYSYRGPYKHEILQHICAAIKDASCHDAFRCYPGLGPGMHLKWADRWKEVIEDHCVFSWPRNDTMIHCVLHVLASSQ